MDRIGALSTFVQHNPPDPIPVYGFTLAHKAQGHYDEAERYCSQLHETLSHYLSLCLSVGKVLVLKQRYTEAAAYYEEDLRLSTIQNNAHAQ